MPDEASGLTERQKKWFASVRANLEANTGRSLAEWVEIGKGAPAGGQRATLKWFKDTHGLLQNSAMFVLHAMEGAGGSDETAAAARAALWSDPGPRAILEAVERLAVALGGVVVGQRKAFTAFSREFQFAALKPLKGGGARLGLAVELDADPRLQPRGNESWSERLPSKLELGWSQEVDDRLAALLRAAWERS